MNSLWFFPQELQPDGSILLSNPQDLRTEHLSNTLKAEIGQKFKAFIVNQGNCLVEIREVENSFFRLRVCGNRPSPPSYQLTMIVGLSRPQTVKKVLEFGTTMGVSRFLFLPAFLSEKSYGTSKIFEDSEVKKHLLLGLSQSGNLFQLPEVQVLKSFKQLEKIVENSRKYLCSLTEKTQKPDMPKRASEPVVLAIGPERGWTGNEEEQFLQLGFHRLGLYPTTLRVEAAAVSALTQWFLGLESSYE